MTESLIDTLPSPTPGLEPGLIACLAADLGSAGWSVDAMETMISPTARAALMRNQRVPAVRELQRKDSPAAVLTRFFVLGCAESGDVLAQALPTLGAVSYTHLDVYKRQRLISLRRADAAGLELMRAQPPSRLFLSTKMTGLSSPTMPLTKVTPLPQRWRLSEGSAVNCPKAP